MEKTCSFCGKIGSRGLSNKLNELKYPESKPSKTSNRRSIPDFNHPQFDQRKVVDDLIQKNYQDINDVDQKHHEVLTILDYQRGKLKEGIENSELQEQETDVSIGQITEDLFKRIESVLKFLKEKNTAVIVRQKTEIVIVSGELKTIISVHVLKSFGRFIIQTASKQQSDEMKSLIDSVPFNKDSQWKFVRVLYCQEQDDQNLPCEACKKFVINSTTNLESWWSQIKSNLSSSKNDLATYKMVMKYFIYRVFTADNTESKSRRRTDLTNRDNEKASLNQVIAEVTPSDDVGYAKLRNRKSPTQILVLMKGAPARLAVERVSMRLKSEATKSIVILEKNDKSLYLQLKYTFIGDKILLDTDQDSIETFNKSEDKILVITSQSQVSLEEFPVSLIILFLNSNGDQKHSEFFLSCDSNLVVVCDEDYLHKIQPVNAAFNIIENIYAKVVINRRKKLLKKAASRLRHKAKLKKKEKAYTAKFLKKNQPKFLNTFFTSDDFKKKKGIHNTSQNNKTIIHEQSESESNFEKSDNSPDFHKDDQNATKKAKKEILQEFETPAQHSDSSKDGEKRSQTIRSGPYSKSKVKPLPVKPSIKAQSQISNSEESWDINADILLPLKPLAAIPMTNNVTDSKNVIEIKNKPPTEKSAISQEIQTSNSDSGNIAIEEKQPLINSVYIDISDNITDKKEETHILIPKPSSTEKTPAKGSQDERDYDTISTPQTLKSIVIGYLISWKRCIILTIMIGFLVIGITIGLLLGQQNKYVTGFGTRDCKGDNFGKIIYTNTTTVGTQLQLLKYFYVNKLDSGAKMSLSAVQQKCQELNATLWDVRLEAEWESMLKELQAKSFSLDIWLNGRVDGDNCQSGKECLKEKAKSGKGLPVIWKTDNQASIYSRLYRGETSEKKCIYVEEGKPNLWSTCYCELEEHFGICIKRDCSLE